MYNLHRVAGTHSKFGLVAVSVGWCAMWYSSHKGTARTLPFSHEPQEDEGKQAPSTRERSTACYTESSPPNPTAVLQPLRAAVCRARLLGCRKTAARNHQDMQRLAPSQRTRTCAGDRNAQQRLALTLLRAQLSRLLVLPCTANQSQHRGAHDRIYGRCTSSSAWQGAPQEMKPLGRGEGGGEASRIQCAAELPGGFLQRREHESRGRRASGDPLVTFAARHRTKHHLQRQQSLVHDRHRRCSSPGLLESAVSRPTLISC